MTNYNNKDLYNACMNVCRSLTMLLIERDRVMSDYGLDSHTKEKIMDFHEENLKHDLSYLYDVVISIDKNYIKRGEE